MTTVRKFYEMKGFGGGYDPLKYIKELQEQITLTESQRQSWADMCIKKQARIEQLEKGLKRLRTDIFESEGEINNLIDTLLNP